jgi:hypothetical protein
MDNSRAFCNLSEQTRVNYQLKTALASKYPLLVLKPKFSKKLKSRNEEFDLELIKLDIKYADFVEQIKFTENENLMIYCKSAESYTKFLKLKIFREGQIIELRHATEEKCIVIRGINIDDINEHVNIEAIKSDNGINKFEKLTSFKINSTPNMVKAYCYSVEGVNSLCKDGIKFGHQIFRCTKFIRKQRVIICFDCGAPGHVSKDCKSVNKVCIRCSSKDHNRGNCPLKANENSDYNGFKCPNCNENHPATYGGCKKVKDKLKSLYENKQSHNNRFVDSNNDYLKVASININRNDSKSKNIEDNNNENILTTLNELKKQISDQKEQINKQSEQLNNQSELLKKVYKINENYENLLKSHKDLESKFTNLDSNYKKLITNTTGLISDLYFETNNKKYSENFSDKMKLYFHLEVNKNTKKLTPIKDINNKTSHND